MGDHAGVVPRRLHRGDCYRQAVVDRQLFVVDVEAAVHHELEPDQQRRLIDAFGAYGFHDHGGDEFRITLSDSVHAADEGHARSDVAARVLDALPPGSVVLSMTVIVSDVPDQRSRLVN